MPNPPARHCEKKGDRLVVTAEFAAETIPESSSLHWSFARSPDDSDPYLYDEWQSAPMERAGENAWSGQIPLPGNAKTVDVLTWHGIQRDGIQTFISCPYTRVSLQ